MQSNVERLSGYIIKLGFLAIFLALCWYFRTALIYIILAFVVSLIGQPVVKLLRKIKVKGHSAPSWLLAVITIFLILFIMSMVVTEVIPVVTGIISDASLFNNIQMPDALFFSNINHWMVEMIPGLSPDFDAVSMVMDYLKELIADFSFTGLIGSVASAASSFAIGLFSVVFISFFFIKDDTLFSKIIATLAPDELEQNMVAAVDDIEHLLSRYFVGIIIEVFCVALIDFVGLSLIAQIGPGYAMGIAFIAGILNIIPYIGPLIGELMGVVLCVALKYGAGVGMDVNIWLFALVVLAIMLSAQLVDNFVLQPLIYSKSIRSTPLEIFIVILLAGHIAGVVGMLAAIPAYTVVRVVACRFFRDSKIVRRLMPDSK